MIARAEGCRIIIVDLRQCALHEECAWRANIGRLNQSDWCITDQCGALLRPAGRMPGIRFEKRKPHRKVWNPLFDCVPWMSSILILHNRKYFVVRVRLSATTSLQISLDHSNSVWIYKFGCGRGFGAGKRSAVHQKKNNQREPFSFRTVPEITATVKHWKWTPLDAELA